MVTPVVNRPTADEIKAMELKTAKFQPFDEGGIDRSVNVTQQNIDLIIDVPLQVTVVLGKTKKSIREILNLGLGSVIVLDRLAGEMVDVLVNGKTFARGEVVVIDDNYGVRITEMMPGQVKL
jgi:flagellar motor switch protein FliN/FliY